MSTIPKIVLENPFRILGVYANSFKKDIIANKGKAMAFLKVNKPVEFPLDLKETLPLLPRTLDMMNEAEAHLAIAKEQIKYTQFWFLKMTPIDDIAFNHLVAGNISQAKEMWSKQESLSSLHNKLVCFLIEDKPWLALKTAEKLYKNFGESYINKVDANCTLQMSGTELFHQFIDSLGEEVGMQKLLSYELEIETKNYISSQTVGPLINNISSEVDKAKQVDRKDPMARKNAGQNLMVATKEPLQQLKGILTANDSQYQMIADKLGLEILQCGIDYFNKSEDDDAPHTAMKLQKYAQSIVMGTLAKQRCEENVKILKKIIDELPPKEVTTEDKAIKAELAEFVRLPDKISHAMTLLNNTKPHLCSIRMKLGATNEYLLKKSTQIVGNALHNVVGEVNEAQEPLARLSKLLGEMDPTARRILLSSNNDVSRQFREIEERVKSVLREAWKVTLLMDEFEMENDFKSHYRENRNTLKSLCSNFDVSTSEGEVNSTYKMNWASEGGVNSTTRTVATPSPRPVSTSKPSSLRTSTAYSNSSTSKSSSSSSDGPNGCIVAIAIIVILGTILGAIISANDGDFAVGYIWAFFIACIVYKVNE
ncbi:MAG: hypothetical protein J6U08_00355 [Paludibacteraceae bacterium]|nr:hypothetical protein [Paludibacteraceae bacterium]